MNSTLEPVLLNAAPGGWGNEVDRLRTLLGAPDNPALFPPHFLKATFPSIDGRIILFELEQKPAAFGFLFPLSSGVHSRQFTLRFHRVVRGLDIGQAESVLKESGLLGKDEAVFYDPSVEQTYASRKSGQVKDLDVGLPDAEEALALRRLQDEIWGGERDFLYPSDIHSREFGSSLSLVARFRGVLAGFLFGFYKFGEPSLPEIWRLRSAGRFKVESQLLGVLPEYRRFGVGFALKRAQAETARREGIDVINWTVDPLQFANARLNFGRLRAISFDFYPDHYPFRNELNQVAPSRLGITWLVDSQRVRNALSEGSGPGVVDLEKEKGIQKLARDWQKEGLDGDAPGIALEIPENWAALQKGSAEEAWAWREATDTFFQNHLGFGQGQYVLTDVGEVGDRKFLVARRADTELLEQLGN